MDEQLQQLLAMLGVSSVAEASAAITRFNAFMSDAKNATGKASPVEILDATRASLAFTKAIESATGKTGDDAVGLVRAAMTSHAELPKAQERVAELEKAADAHELDKAVAQAKDDKKWSPALEAEVREAFAKGNVTLAGAKSWLKSAHPVKAFENKTEPAPEQAAASGDAPKWNGKTYAELKPIERHALSKADPELFAHMRATYRPGLR